MLRDLGRGLMTDLRAVEVELLARELVEVMSPFISAIKTEFHTHIATSCTCSDLTYVVRSACIVTSIYGFIHIGWSEFMAIGLILTRDRKVFICDMQSTG